MRVPGPEVPGDTFETSLGFRARRAWETPVRAETREHWTGSPSKSSDQIGKIVKKCPKIMVSETSFGYFSDIFSALFEWILQPQISEKDGNLPEIERKGHINLADALSGPLRLRVQSRSRTRLRIAASISFFCFALVWTFCWHSLSWWTFQIYFYFFARESGKGSPRHREGGVLLVFLKVPRGGGSPKEMRGGGEGPGCLQRSLGGRGLIFFFRGRNSHQSASGFSNELPVTT